MANPSPNFSTTPQPTTETLLTPNGDLFAQALHRDDASLQTARHADAIFYLQVRHPRRNKPLKVHGPYSLEGAIKRIDEFVVAIHHDDLNKTITPYFGDPTSWSTGRKKWLTKIAAFHLPLPDGQIISMSIEPHVNPPVAELWRDVCAGTKAPRPTYLVWSVENDAAVEEDPTAQRNIHGAFASMRAAERHITRWGATPLGQKHLISYREGPVMGEDGVFTEWEDWEARNGQEDMVGFNSWEVEAWVGGYVEDEGVVVDEEMD